MRLSFQDVNIGPGFDAAAVAVTRSYPHAPPLDVVPPGRTGVTLDLSAPWLQPAAPFGQVLAAAFDRRMTPAEWAAWSVPPAEPALWLALVTVWHDVLLAAFAARFALLAPQSDLSATP